MSPQEMFDRRAAEIHGLQAGPTDGRSATGHDRDLRHEEFQALVDAFLGDDYDQRKVRAVEMLQLSLQEKQAVLYQSLSQNRLSPEAYVSALNDVSAKSFEDIEVILGEEDFVRLFGLPSRELALLVEREEFLRSYGSVGPGGDTRQEEPVVVWPK